MRLIFASLLFLLVACNNEDKKENTSMAGAYKMLSQSVKTDKTDSTYTNSQQLKIYTDDYMMYANFNPADSTGGFGIGTYSVNKNSVTENVIYTADITVKDDNPHSFNLVIEKTSKGFKQVIPDMLSQGEHIKLTEEYETAGTDSKSPLDGAWKLTSAYDVRGKDTVRSVLTQFKVYYAGHFIFGHAYSDSANKNHTGMGYGKFAMTGTTKSKESIAVSTYYQIRGQDVDIDIEMNGNDEYKQTIIAKDSTKDVEIYQRLKK